MGSSFENLKYSTNNDFKCADDFISYTERNLGYHGFLKAIILNDDTNEILIRVTYLSGKGIKSLSYLNTEYFQPTLKEISSLKMNTSNDCIIHMCELTGRRNDYIHKD